MGNRWSRLRTALAAMVLVAGTAWAGVPDDGLSLRALGFFEAESSGSGTCEIPSATGGIPLSSDVIGLNNTFGIPTIMYPPSGCGGWLQLQNTMLAQGVSIDRIDIRLRIAGAGRFRQFVPTRTGFPTACRAIRKSVIFSGMHLFPFGSTPDNGNTGSGVPHLGFVNVFPMVDPQVMSCLREQYSGLPPSVYASFPLIVRAVATGITDSGKQVRSNPAKFTLTLIHLCGNGRLDNSEVCDPNAPNTCDIGPCDTSVGECRDDPAVSCQTDADCSGHCIQEGDPMECSCLYGGN